MAILKPSFLIGYFSFSKVSSLAHFKFPSDPKTEYEVDCIMCTSQKCFPTFSWLLLIRSGRCSSVGSVSVSQAGVPRSNNNGKLPTVGLPRNSVVK